MCYKNGGAVFLIPYMCALFLVVVPMFIIETAYGQLVQCPLHQRWGAIHRRWWTVGLIQIMICFFTSIYYITLMAWSFSFLFNSFRAELPWLTSENV